MLLLKNKTCGFVNNVLLLMAFLLCSQYIAIAQTSITISAGVATSNNHINDVYNTNRLKTSDSFFDIIRESVRTGYALQAQLRFGVGGNLFVSGGVGFARFPLSSLSLTNPSTGTTLVDLVTTQNIVPINAGFEYFLFRTIISPYVGCDFSYSYISNTVDYPAGGGLSVPLDLKTVAIDNRYGGALSAGLIIDAGVLAVNIDSRYRVANILGKVDSEVSKAYLTTSVGIVFGWK